MITYKFSIDMTARDRSGIDVVDVSFKHVSFVLFFLQLYNYFLMFCIRSFLEKFWF